MSGFSIYSTDADGFAIGESGDITLSGIDEPTDFNYVAFSFVDTGRVGLYSEFRIEIGMKSSLGPQCFVRIVFPDDFKTDF